MRVTAGFAADDANVGLDTLDVIGTFCGSTAVAVITLSLVTMFSS